MKYGPIIGLIVLISSYCWLISYGTMSLNHGEMRGLAYDSLGDHLLYASAEVDPKAIESESFIEHGKTFMYFGPFPALLRIIPNKILPSMYGKWSRWSCLLGGLLSIAAFFKIISYRTKKYVGRNRTRLVLAASVGFGFGTPIFFLMSCGFIYHEAIIWGLCCSLWGIWFWLKTRDTNSSIKDLIALSTCAGLALLSRVTFGVPLFLLLAASTIRWLIHQNQKASEGFPKLLLTSLRFLSPAICCLAFQLWYNYARFGSPFVFVDITHHTSLIIAPTSYQGRLADLGIFNLGRVWIGLVNYLGFDSRYFLSQMPFITVMPVRLDTIHYPIGYIEWTLPLIFCSPWLVLAGLVGLIVVLAQHKWSDLLSALALTIPVIALCIFYFVTHRYSAEFIPPLVFLGAIGSRQILRWRNRPMLQKLCLVTFESLCLVSVLTTGLSTFSWNTRHNWAAPMEYRVQIADNFKEIDRVLGTGKGS